MGRNTWDITRGTVTDIFTTRELAIGVWASILFAIMFVLMKDKRYARQIVVTLLSPKLLVLFAAFGLYIAFLSALLHQLGLWEWADLKDTIFWSVVAFGMLMNTNKLLGGKSQFRNMVINTLKITAIVEFIVNLYVGPLWFELILVPALFLLTMFALIADMEPKTRLAKGLFDTALSAIGLGLLGYVVFSIISDFGGFATFEHIRSFMLIPMLTIMFFPFLYMFALYVEYEQLLTRLKFQNKDSSLVWHAMRRIIVKFHVNLWTLAHWAKRGHIFRLQNKSDVAKLLT